MNRSTVMRGAALLLAVVLAVMVVIFAIERLTRSDGGSIAAVTPIPFPTPARVEMVDYIGDSYSAGTGSTGYNRKFTTLVSAYEGWKSENHAYGGTGYVRSVGRDAEVGCGQPFCPAYPAVIAEVSKDRPTVVMVSGGRNDVGVPEKEETSAIRSFYRSLRAALPSARIVATSPLWDNRKPPAQLETISAAVEDSVRAVGGYYLDIGQPLRDHPELVAQDGVHPNDQGHAKIAIAIEVALARVHIDGRDSRSQL